MKTIRRCLRLVLIALLAGDAFADPVEIKVVLKRNGVEIAREVSNPHFDQLAAAAEPQWKPGKEKRKATE